MARVGIFMSTQFNLSLPTDVVAFGKPYDSEELASLVVGTYKFVPETNVKCGSIHVFSVSSNTGCKPRHSLESLGAVLDLKWCLRASFDI